MAFFRPLSSACAARVLVCASAWACVCVRVVLVRVCVCTRVPPRMLDGDSQPPSSLFHPVSLSTRSPKDYWVRPQPEPLLYPMAAVPGGASGYLPGAAAYILPRRACSACLIPPPSVEPVGIRVPEGEA